MSDDGERKLSGLERMLQAHKERLAPVKAALRELSAGDLAEVLFEELDRRRLDADGNPTDPEGLYNATTTGLSALIGYGANVTVTVKDGVTVIDDTEAKRSAALVQRLAAVGRGVQLAADSSAAEIREVATLIELMIKTSNFREEAKPTAIAMTLAGRFKRPVDTQRIASALKNENVNGRLAEVVLAAGILPESVGPKTDPPEVRARNARRKALSHVRRAIENE